MKVFFNIIGLWFGLMPLLSLGQDAQFVPYRGGGADGHHLSALTQFTRQSITMYSPFNGAPLADGHAADSLIGFDPRGMALLYSPFSGAALGDGFGSDSLIGFQQGYITMFNPFGGGNNDGHHEGVLCNFPKTDGDTTIYLPCSNDIVDLTTLVFQTNYSAKWNTPNPQSVGAGTYELRINNSGKCLDTAMVIVNLEIAIWNGTTNTNWHHAANWSNNKIPGPNTHVIIPVSSPECIIRETDAEARSVQVRNGASLRAINQKNMMIQGTCSQLPNP